MDDIYCNAVEVHRRGCRSVASGFFSVTARVFMVVFAGLSGLHSVASTCLECHGDPSLTNTNANGETISLFVDEARLRASVHGTKTCVTCHADVTDAHPDDDIPVKSVQCGSCHTEAAISYESSVHGQKNSTGTRPYATCAECHGYHSVLPSTLPESSLHYARIAKTCGDCHPDAAAEYQQSVHGKALVEGRREAPTCTDCHPGHAVHLFGGESAQRISLEVCGRCHASESINTRFNLPADRVKTYFASYHGLASRFGKVRVAHCGSCHGNHLVLPRSDPRSDINPERLGTTCGKCHPGASAKFAMGRIHVDPVGKGRASDTGALVNHFVRRLYQVLIVVCIGLMAGHNALIFLRKALARRRTFARAILRMNGTQRCQHLLLLVSFVILALSGFALRHPGSWLSWLMFDSEPVRRWVHRSAAIVLGGTALWHLWYVLFSLEGRRLLGEFFPRVTDLRHLVSTLKGRHVRNSGATPAPKFSYVEKIEYWAVVWGITIMGVTGLMLWFKVEVTQWIPRWVVEVAGTIHYYEAVLATLAVVVWHLYHVIFDPDVYPMNWAWLDGYARERMSNEPVTTKNPDGSKDCD